MVDQREALAVTTGLTDTVYLDRRDFNRQPLDQQATTLHFCQIYCFNHEEYMRDIYQVCMGDT